MLQPTDTTKRPHSIFFIDQQRTATARSESCPFFKQNKNITYKQFTRNQPDHSEDEDYFNSP